VRVKLHAAVLVYSAALMLATVAVVMKNATDEPYVVFRPGDALVQVGFGVTLLVLWCQLALAVAVGVMTRRLVRSALLLVLVGVILCPYLYLSSTGYVTDVVRHLRVENADEP
jgi:hypothetical protein